MTKQPAFLQTAKEIAEEKGLDFDVVISTIEQAIAAAYRKDYGKPRQMIKAKLQKDGSFKIFQIYQIVKTEDEIENEQAQATPKQALQILKENKIKLKNKPKAEDEIKIPLPQHSDFGRIAAQTAKQVIIQRLREAERNMLFEEYKDKEGTIMPATVQQVEGRTVILNMGKANAIMIPSDQIRSEHYYTGQRFRVYVKGVEDTPKGPRILVSRSSAELIRGLFELEVPEIQAGSVKIRGIAREAGARTKVAVSCDDENLDPVGSCVGQRGTRIQAILAEVGDEKIDIILWDKNPKQFLSNALSPARVSKIIINKKEKTAKVYVDNDQLSLAIGRGGQNVRLAGIITQLEVDIKETPDKTNEQATKKKSTANKAKKNSKPGKKTTATSKKTTKKPNAGKAIKEKKGKSNASGKSSLTKAKSAKK